MPRPWQSEVPPLLESVEETVPFPTDEEDDGLVRVTWRGPSALVSTRTYLTSTDMLPPPLPLPLPPAPLIRTSMP